MLTSLPIPSAPRAALVKLVAILKKYTIPPSLTGSIVDISVFCMFTTFIAISTNLSPVTSNTLFRTSTGCVASPSIITSQKLVFFSLSIDLPALANPITFPVTPALFFAS
jgi:Na+/glutamate symporter